MLYTCKAAAYTSELRFTAKSGDQTELSSITAAAVCLNTLLQQVQPLNGSAELIQQVTTQWFYLLLLLFKFEQHIEVCPKLRFSGRCRHRQTEQDGENEADGKSEHT